MWIFRLRTWELRDRGQQRSNQFKARTRTTTRTKTWGNALLGRNIEGRKTQFHRRDATDAEKEYVRNLGTGLLDFNQIEDENENDDEDEQVEDQETWNRTPSP